MAECRCKTQYRFRKAGSVLLSLVVAGAARGAPLSLFTEDKPPRQMIVAGKLTGPVVDEVRYLMDDARVDYRMQVVPWARALAIARSQPGTCVFNTARTAERERYFTWIGPLSSQRWALFARADSAVTIGKLDDARPYRIGTYYQDVRDAYLRERGFEVDAAPQDANNIDKLIAGRIDLWAADEDAAAQLLASSGRIGAVKPVFVFRKLDGYLACNRDTSADVLARLEHSFGKPETMRQFLAIRERYASARQ